jgi:hypothetical protein
MSLNIDFGNTTVLCEIMGRNGSDKGNIDLSNTGHNYTILYHDLFKHFQDKEIRLFELGIGTNNPNLPSSMGINGVPGASLFGWREYFPKAKIYGADVDKNILFNTDNIKTYYCDQLNTKSIEDMWNLNDELKDEFDIIIEDGLHTPEANINFFENSIHKLKKNGYYIIEDVYYDTSSYNKFIADWKNKDKSLSFEILKLPIYHNISKTANNIILIKKN